MTELGDLLRHARRAAGVSQRNLAAAAGLGAVVVAKAEAGNRPDTVSRLLAAAGFGLQLVPLVPPDEQETAAAREWLCRHPLDRLAAVVLRQPEVLGLPTREGARLLVGLLERAPVLLLGDVAHRLWVHPRPTDPPLTRVEGLVLWPNSDHPDLLNHPDLRWHHDLGGAGLTPHVVATSVALDLLRGGRVLAPRDLMLLDGWNPRLATAVQVWESLQQRDTGGRHPPAHQPLARAERDGRGQWPSRRDRVGVVPPPPWEERRKPLALNREIPTPPDEFYDVEEWDPAEHPPLVGGQDPAQLSPGP